MINPLNAILYHGKAYMIGETGDGSGGWPITMGATDVFSVDLQTGETETILATQTFGTDGIALINFEHAENGTAYLYLYGRNTTEGHLPMDIMRWTWKRRVLPGWEMRKTVLPVPGETEG